MLRGKVLFGRVAGKNENGLVANGIGQLLTSRLEAFKFGVGGNDRDNRAFGFSRNASADASEYAAQEQREKRTQKEKDECLGEHRRGKVAAGDDESTTEKTGQF